MRLGLRCPMTCPHGDRCVLERDHASPGCNHRVCDCNEPDRPVEFIVELAGSFKPFERARVNVGRTFCRPIREGISLEFHESDCGLVVMSFEDLERIYLAAKAWRDPLEAELADRQGEEQRS